jgi:hypothetical protein
MLLDEKMARNNCIRLGNEYLIYPDKLEIINTEAFAIGDKVRSLCGNGQSTFIVRGYEPRDNRVIVESLNTPSDRVRYAYKITELEKVPDGYKFERGKKYKINGNFTVLCCEPGLNSLGFVQIEGPNIGRFYECAHRAMFITDGGLSELGFHNIQPIK